MSDRPADPERLRKAFVVSAESKTRTEDCPSAEDFWSAARNELPPARTEELALHTAECGTCAKAWRLARDISAEALGDITEEGTASVPTRRIGWRRLAAVAAAAVIIIAVGLQMPGWLAPPEKPAVRTSPEETIRTLLAQDELLPRDACILRWAGPEGASYRVRVATQDLEVLVESGELDATDYRVPPQALASLPPGGSFVWQVTARLPDGRRPMPRAFRARVE